MLVGSNTVSFDIVGDLVLKEVINIGDLEGTLEIGEGWGLVRMLDVADGWMLVTLLAGATVALTPTISCQNGVVEEEDPFEEGAADGAKVPSSLASWDDTEAVGAVVLSSLVSWDDTEDAGVDIVNVVEEGGDVVHCMPP